MTERFDNKRITYTTTLQSVCVKRIAMRHALNEILLNTGLSHIPSPRIQITRDI